MVSIKPDDLYKKLIEASNNLGLPSDFLNDTVASSYSTASLQRDYLEREYSHRSSYSPPEPKHVYLGMYVYVEKWPEGVHSEKSSRVACINIDCSYYLDQYLFNDGRGNCTNCGQPLRYYAVEKKHLINMDELIHKPLGVKCFRLVETKDKKVIVPYPKHASELGGTIVGGELTPLKGIIDALNRSEKVHEYWHVLCASLQRHNAKFQPGRGLVII